MTRGLDAARRIQLVTGRDYSVVLAGTVHGLDRPGLDRFFDQVMEELLRIEAKDPSIDVEFSTASMRISVAVEAANPLEATSKGSGAVRSAIHAAGGGTPDWPAAENLIGAVELTGVKSELAGTDDDASGCDDEDRLVNT